MEWIKLILPLIGVVIGFFLSDRAKIWSDNRQDKRKLKKLLFYLLELRFIFTRQLNAQREINNYYQQAEEKIKLELGVSTSSDIEIARPIVEKIIKNNLGNNNRFEFLEHNIDTVLDDLAEVLPILAYELSGQHNIKQRLNIIDNFFNEVNQQTEGMPFDIKDWINSKLTNNLISDLDETIKKISFKIDKGMWVKSKEKIDIMYKVNNENMDSFLTELIVKAKDNSASAITSFED